MSKFWQIFIRILPSLLFLLLGLIFDVDEELLAGGLEVGIILLVHHRSLLIAALLGDTEPRLLEIILILSLVHIFCLLFIVHAISLDGSK